MYNCTVKTVNFDWVEQIGIVITLGLVLIVVIFSKFTCCGGTLNALALVSTLVHTSKHGLMNTTPE